MSQTKAVKATLSNPLRKASVVLVGATPLFMHSARAINPLEPQVMEKATITKKRTKTPADHKAIARLEWELGLYHDPDLGPYLPGECLWRSFIEGAKATRQGKSLERAILDLAGQMLPVDYRGPRDKEALWADPKFRDIRNVRNAGASGGSVMRCRPQFPSWMLEAEFLFDVEMVSPEDLERFIEQAGRYNGIGDGRTIGKGRYRLANLTIAEA